MAKHVRVDGPNFGPISIKDDEKRNRARGVVLSRRESFLAQEGVEDVSKSQYSEASSWDEWGEGSHRCSFDPGVVGWE